MASTQLLRRRIRSVSNTKQITKAMELVAAARLRRVQAAAASARTYSDAAMGILRRLSNTPEAANHAYFKPTNSAAKLYIIFNSDRGLAGAYNANVFNAAAKAFAQDNRTGFRPAVIAFGRKGARHFSRGSNIDLIGAYENLPDDPHINFLAPALETIDSGIIQGRYTAVSLIFTESVSTLVQQVRILQLIPVVPAAESDEKDNQPNLTYSFEPDVEVVLADALRLYLESALRRARVEGAASEHAMRMVSMGSANRNASDLIDDLTLELNATRQAAITAEMAEIIGGGSAII